MGGERMKGVWNTAKKHFITSSNSKNSSSNSSSKDSNTNTGNGSSSRSSTSNGHGTANSSNGSGKGGGSGHNNAQSTALKSNGADGKAGRDRSAGGGGKDRGGLASSKDRGAAAHRESSGGATGDEVVAGSYAYSPPMDGIVFQRVSPDRMPPPASSAPLKVALPNGAVAPSSSTPPLLLNGVEDTPVADVGLPRHRPQSMQNRRSTSFDSARSRDEPSVRSEFVKELPLLRDTAPHKREALFQQKLKLCSVVFDMTDPSENPRAKEIKRLTLLELVDYVNSPQGQQIFTLAVIPDVMAMVKANVCRALPPQPDDCDPDKDEPLLEEAWPHLQVVYEFLVRFVVSSEVDAKQAKQYVDQNLCLQLVELFDSEDPRERDYLKTILHRVYGKFMMHRAFIRRAVGNAFLRFVYECPRHNGIGELLEILGSIVNGFATPLKKEHVDFLQVCLLPLHTPSMLNMYHQQLSYCVVQYVEKEAATATSILKSLIKFWPWRSSSKQVLFLNELEEVLELLVGPEQIAEVEDQLFNLLARCISSEHFQVAERALFLWNNEQLATTGVLSMQYPRPLLPVIYGPLRERSTRHWNSTVEGLAHNVLRMYSEQDAAEYERCHQRHILEEEERGRRRARANAHWSLLEELAHAKAGE